MARRKSDMEALVKLASMLPWWASLILAAVLWVVLGAYAGSEVQVVEGDPFGSLHGAIPRAFAGAARIILPVALVIGASISAFRSLRNGQLFHRVASHSNSSTARYHDDDVDPLVSMSWQEFEHLVGEVYRRRGYSVLETAGGADGGVDLVARRDGERVLVQCKRWRTSDVGVTVVRELLGVVAASGAAGGAVVTVGRFTDEARKFAAGTCVELIDGDLLRRQARSAAGLQPLPELVPALSIVDDTPACPVCDSSMVRRIAGRGPNKGKPFWGCPRFPSCRGTRP